MVIRFLTFVRACLIYFKILPIIKRILYSPDFKLANSSNTNTFFYRIKVMIEKANFGSRLDVHDNPPIHKYWMNTFILPMLKKYQYDSIDDYVYKNFLRVSRLLKGKKIRCVSLGTGNCDFEIKLALKLKKEGINNFVIECIDFNKEMFKRAGIEAEKNNLKNNLIFTEADLNNWKPKDSYDVVLAFMSLHHIVKLENLFAEIKKSLDAKNGRFIICDVIGRNGHMRWPEALKIVNEYWRNLPKNYRFNRMLNSYQKEYLNYDCSKSGFEGIRAQEILPLLLKNFSFESFFAFANIVECFVDRSIGGNFDPTKKWDRDFIKKLHMRDMKEMKIGNLKPTHMLAVVANRKVDILEYQDPITPSFSVRKLNSISL